MGYEWALQPAFTSVQGIQGEMIYFAHCKPIGSVKIGTAKEPKKRLSSLQTGCPGPLQLVGVIPGGQIEEAALHREFKQFRMNGEWFRDDPELMTCIHRLLDARRGSSLLSEHVAVRFDESETADSRELNFFISQGVCFPLLCYLTTLAVGHMVSVYVGTASLLKAFEIPVVEGGEFYQVMRWNDAKGSGKEFWKEHLWNRPQWFVTPETACAAYVASYREWIAKGGES